MRTVKIVMSQTAPPWLPQCLAVERPEGGILEQVLRVGVVPLAEPERGAEEGVEVLGEHFLEGPNRRTDARSA
jgi:hypothetical protein